MLAIIQWRNILKLMKQKLSDWNSLPRENIFQKQNQQNSLFQKAKIRAFQT